MKHLPCQLMKMKTSQAKDYLKSYEKKPGRELLKKELEFVESRLGGCEHLLSVGCGPAVLEGKLKAMHDEMEIVGLDASRDMIKLAPESINVVYGDAQSMGFNDETFDCMLYITSLEFIDDYKKAIKESNRVLKRKGKILVMMLNPASDYFAERYSNENSYIRKNIKHRNISEIVECISRYFSIKSKGYFLGIKNNEVFDTVDPKGASLYVVEAVKDGR